MSFLIDTNKYKRIEKFYGGNAGLKDCMVDLENNHWIIKFPKDTHSMKDVKIPFTTSPLSEYVGSHIFEILGFDVHKTHLGVAYNKITKLNQLVVLCKDFIKYPESELIDYTKIKNKYSDELHDQLIQIHKLLKSASDSNFLQTHTSIEEIFIQFKSNSFFKEHPEIKKHFWKMFIVDFLISNNDRNPSNWGFIKNLKTNKYQICPVFDNGACFLTKHDDEKINRILNSKEIFENSVNNVMSHFVFNNHKSNFVNLIKYLKLTNQDEQFNEALLELMPIITKNISKINDFIDKIPESENGIKIISQAQKEYFKKSFNYLYKTHLLPIYNKLIHQDLQLQTNNKKL